MAVITTWTADGERLGYRQFVQFRTARSAADIVQPRPHSAGLISLLKPRDIWVIRFYVDEHKRLRNRALFDMAIDS